MYNFFFHVTGERLQVIFTNIDYKDHTSPFYYYLKVTDGQYIGKTNFYYGTSENTCRETFCRKPHICGIPGNLYSVLNEKKIVVNNILCIITWTARPTTFLMNLGNKA